jgi:uncharacterized protein
VAPLRQAPAIDRFGAGGFTLGEARFEGSILILDDAVRPWTGTTLSALAPSDFAPVLASPAAVEFVLLGCGLRMAPPPRPVREALAAANLGLEVMDTPAACRLYNVLASEGRRLAAALVAV